MSLLYDFDIVRRDGAPVVARFRSPETIAALSGADAVVRAYFEASGFDFRSHDSGAGDGKYPSGDDADRVAVIERLGDNLWQHDIADADLNGFDFGAFMVHLSEAEPVEMRHAAFSFGLPVDRLTQMFRRARPTRTLTRPLG